MSGFASVTIDDKEIIIETAVMSGQDGEFVYLIRTYQHKTRVEPPIKVYTIKQDALDHAASLIITAIEHKLEQGDNNGTGS